MNTKRFNTWRREQGVDGCSNCKAEEHSHVWKCQCGRELAWQDNLLPIACECGGQRATLFCPTNQSRVFTWVRKVFSEKEATDVPERALRMAEEALELAQACEVDTATLHRLVDYVMSRPIGKPAQEIAGTMVTVYALAGALGVDADSEFETELERIQQPEVIERCQRRQHEKRAALAPSCCCGERTEYDTAFCPIHDAPKDAAKPEPYTDNAFENFEIHARRHGFDKETEVDEFCDDGKTGALR